MATYLENLVAARDSLGQQLAAVAAQAGPNVSIDGKSVDKVGFMSSAMKQLEDLARLIAQAGGDPDPGQAVPVWDVTQALPG